MSLNSKQQLRIDVISRLLAGTITMSDAIKLLGVSKRSIYRYKADYLKNGVLSALHGNTAKKPHNKIPAHERNRMLRLCTTDYYDLNRLHAYEKLVEHHNFKGSYSTFRNWCNAKNMLTKKTNKRKRKKARYRRERMKQTGLMIQMDGSPHMWFGRRKTCLIIAIDDANGEIISGKFSPTETTFACMEVIKDVFRSKGLFKVLYTDKAGIFGGTTNNPYALKRQNFSQLEERLNEFGINIIHAHSPEAKGRVERAFNTLQDRLVSEMRLEKIFTMRDANNFLNEYFLPEIFNKRFTVDPVIPETAFTPVIATNLDNQFYMRETRRVRLDHTISYQGELWDLKGKRLNLANKVVELRFYPDGSSRIFWRDEEIFLKGVSLLRAA